MATTKKTAPVAEQHEYPIIKTKFDAYTGDEPYLFISYSHRDTEKVYAMLDMLYERRYRIWYDESCETGNDFRDELRHRIEKCAAVVLFVSDASMTSPFCGMEIIVARENGKRIFPVYVDEDVSVPPAFQILLSNTHHGSVNDPGKLLKALVRDLPPEAMDRLTKSEDRLTIEHCEDNGKEIVVDDGIQHIKESAFARRNMLESVTLPGTLKTIEAEAFRSCASLKSMDIPASTDSIGSSAFRDCVSMKSLVIRNGLIKIGERAFENCAELEKITLPDDLAEIYGSVFNGCKKLKSIKLPEQLTVIGENAFADCVALESVELPDSVIKIDDLVFSGCTALKTLKINDGIKKIGKAAFKNCSSLTEAYIPASLNYLSTDLFRGCASLRTIKVDPKNKYYKSEPNKRDGADHVLFNKNKSILVAYPASSREFQYDIPDSVTVISDWAFSEARKLHRISIPDSVNEIGEGAFCNCALLDELYIPDSVTVIDDCAFRGCASLDKIVIPSSVKDLGWGVFDGCKKDMTVYCDEGSAIYKYCVRNRIKNARIEEAEA